MQESRPIEAEKRRKKRQFFDLLARLAEERDPVHASAVRANHLAARPIAVELEKAGFKVDGPGQLPYLYRNYKDAVPILIKWLARVENIDIKGDIVQALTVRFARPEAIRPLIEAFEAEYPEGAPSVPLLKWSIGDALSVVADDSAFSEIVRLVHDKRHARSRWTMCNDPREMLCEKLGSMKNPRAADVLLELIDDDDLALFTIRPLGRLRVKAARSRIEPFLVHPEDWVRREAKRALRKIGVDPEVERERHRAVAPLLRELADAGYPVESVDDLKRYKDYVSAIPILLRWLPLTDDLVIRQAIIASLAQPFARPEAAAALIEPFEAQPVRGPADLYLKWWMGRALSVVADDSVFDDIVRLVRDNRHGRAREMLPDALARMKRPEAVDALIELLGDEDEDVILRAMSALGKRKAWRERAWPHIEAFLRHPNRRLGVEADYIRIRMNLDAKRTKK